MTSGSWRLLLRSVAVAIAIGALFDPVWSANRPQRPKLVAIDLTSSGSPAVERLRANSRAWEVVTREVIGPTLPCAADEQCVVFADGSRDIEVPSDLARPLSLLTLGAPAGPNLAIRSAAGATAHVSAAGSIRVELERTGAIAATDVRVLDGGALVGSATHTWRDAPAATLEIPWWPLDTGARRLKIEATPVAGETTSIDNVIDLGVDVLGERMGVLVFDARPSWISTFVRRALEDDPRFSVRHRARLAPALSAGTPHTRFDAADVEEAGLVIVGGPDALTASEVDLLDRFVRVRGGTLVLLPEQRPSGAVTRLFPGDWSEHLTQAVERVGPLYASEILRSAEPPSARILARSGTAAAIVLLPSDNGRILISGAMDAWRHRDRDANAFDQFWRSVAVDGAASGARSTIVVDTHLASKSAPVRFTVRDRRMSIASNSEASAVVTCGDRPASAVRLLPTATLGEFTGEAASAIGGPCRIDARIDDRTAHAGFAVADRPNRGTNATLSKLERIARASGGIVMNAADTPQLLRELEAQRQPTSHVVSVRPMRASWWIIPFAGCLTAEWWLRRRAGLR
jgi:hypothetical protein